MQALALLILQTQTYTSQSNIVAAQRMAYTILAIMPIFILAGLAIVILPFWFICKKAGFSPWLSLLNIVPFGSIILWYVLAFTEWKVTPVAPPGWAPPAPYPPPPYPPQV